MALAPQFEHVLMQALPAGGEVTGLEPGLIELLIRETAAAAQQLEGIGLPAVLLASTSLRPGLSRMLRRAVSQLKVISHAEVPDSKRIKVTVLLGGNKA